MLSKRKLARDFLLYADRPTFLETVYRSKVTPRQKEILYKHFLDNDSCISVALGLHLSQETVRDELRKSYDLIFNYLFSAKLLPLKNSPLV